MTTYSLLKVEEYAWSSFQQANKNGHVSHHLIYSLTSRLMTSTLYSRPIIQAVFAE